MPWAPSGELRRGDAVGGSDVITISVSAGFGEQLNHAYTLAVPNTVFVARVAQGPYKRERSRPLCLAVYFAKGEHRTSPACEKEAQTRLADAKDPRETRLALLEAYAVADDQDRRNIGLVHLRTAELRGFAAGVAVPRSSDLGKPLPLRSYTEQQPCPGCIEEDADGRRYFDVRQHCEALYLPENRAVNVTDLSNVQLCAYQTIRADLAAFREDLWKALKALSEWTGDHDTLFGALKAIGYVHHRQGSRRRASRSLLRVLPPLGGDLRRRQAGGRHRKGGG